MLLTLVLILGGVSVTPAISFGIIGIFLLLVFSTIFIFVILFFSTKNLEFIKNNIEIVVKEKNYLCCTRKKFNYQLKSIFIDCLISGTEKTQCSEILSVFKVIIYNMNFDKIDLDNNSITEVPFKLFNIFSGYIGIMKDVKKDINSFLSNPNFENKILAELKRYNPNYKQTKRIYFTNGANIFETYDDNFIKLNDYFYSYSCYKLSHESKSKENFQRIDWIYSKNFDRIFIGVVKNDEIYLNKAVYNINTIDKFLLDLKNKFYTFKVILKDGNNYDLCEFRYQAEEDLNNFIYLINGQVNNINNNISNNSAPVSITEG